MVSDDDKEIDERIKQGPDDNLGQVSNAAAPLSPNQKHGDIGRAGNTAALLFHLITMCYPNLWAWDKLCAS